MAKYGLDLPRKKKRNTALVIGFLCFAIVLGTVSTLLMWRSYNYDFNNMFVKQDESTTSVPTTSQVSEVTYSGNYEFLVAVTNDNKTEALFFNIIAVDMSERTIRVVPVDSNIADKKTGLSLDKLLISQGVNQTVSFINSFYGIKIDKYAVLDRKSVV